MKDGNSPHAHSRQLSHAVAIVIAAAFSLVSEAQGGFPGRRGELLHLIQEAVNEAPESGAPRAARAYKELFSGMSQADLRETAKTAPKGIALHAMWQLKGCASRARFDPGSRLSAIRYFEEEAHVPVPAAWAVEFDAHFHSPDQMELNRVLEYYYQRGTTRIEPAPEGLREMGVRFVLNRAKARQRSGFGFWVDDGTRASISGNSLLITQGNNSVSCDARILPLPDEDRTSRRHCAAVVGSRLSFLAFFDDDPEPYPLYCIDTKSGRVRWKAKIWAVYPTGVPYFPSAPPLTHEVYLSVGEGFVSVFGSSLQLYAEAFRTESGEVAARFSTHLCGQWFRGQAVNSE